MSETWWKVSKKWPMRGIIVEEVEAQRSTKCFVVLRDRFKEAKDSEWSVYFNNPKDAYAIGRAMWLKKIEAAEQKLIALRDELATLEGDSARQAATADGLGHKDADPDA